jgi:hypothetical protein
MNVQLTNEPDSFIWHLTTSRVFTYKSLYKEYMNEDTRGVFGSPVGLSHLSLAEFSYAHYSQVCLLCCVW